MIFDLDGTLIDSRQDLANAVNATRAHLGLGPLNNERVYSYVGHGAPELIRRSLGKAATDAEISSGTKFFLAHYRAHVLDCTTLYPGVKGSLEHLHDAGKRMAVLTNKPVRPAQEICEALNLAPFFLHVYGGNSFPVKKPDPLGLRALMDEAGAGPEETVMIGDSENDAAVAHAASVPLVMMRYGYARVDPATLGAAAVLDHFAELPATLERLGLIP